MEVSADSRPHPSTVPALLGAAHPGPALAVTVLAALLGTALDLTPDRVVLRRGLCVWRIRRPGPGGGGGSR